jgi:hypothetical protein
MRAEMREAVKAAFANRHKKPKRRAVDALADVGAGHLTAQGGWLPLDPSPDKMRRLVAAELVHQYLEGEHPSPSTKKVYLKQFRTNVDVLLNDEIKHGGLSGADVDDDIRAALASFAFGCWDESDYRFLRTLVPGFVVAYFALGVRQP